MSTVRICRAGTDTGNYPRGPGGGGGQDLVGNYYNPQFSSVHAAVGGGGGSKLTLSPPSIRS